MADLSTVTALKAAIAAIINNAVPDESIEPDDHNGLLVDLLDTITGLDKVLRHNNETGGYSLTVTAGDLLKLADSGFTGDIDTDTLTAFRTYTFQDASGTVAFLSDIGAGVTNLGVANITATNLDVTSDTGTDATLPSATATDAGLMSAAKFNEVVANNAKVTNVTTDLSITNKTATTLDVASSDGTDATVPSATITEAGLMSATDKVKLDGITDTDDQNASEVPYTNTTSGLTATDVQAAIDEIEGRVDTNDAKVSNVTTNLSEGTATTTTVDVDSSDGTNATLQPASTLRAGVMSKAKFDEVVANNAKVSNVTTNLGVANNTSTNLDVTSSDGTDATLPQATTSLAGLMSGGDKTKLDGIEPLADVTDATNVDAAGAVMNTDASTASMSFVIDEDNMVSDLDTKVPTQQSVKAYVDSQITLEKSYKGGYDAATDTPSLDDGSPIVGIKKGDVYDVTVAGNFFTEAVEVGDTVRANKDNPLVLADWVIVQANLNPASIKTQYESNADTNAYTNAEQTKVGFISVTQAVDLDTMESDIAINNAKVSNVTTNLSSSLSATDVTVESSDGLDVIIPSATASLAGVLTAAKFNEIGANTLKVSNVTTNLGTANNTPTNIDVTSSDGTDATLPSATGSLAGLMTAADKTKLDGISSGATNVTELNDLSDVTTGLPVSPTQADDGKMLFFDTSVGDFITDDTVTHGTSVINGKKASAGTIAKGKPVYLVGFDSDLHTVEEANASAAGTMPVIGFAAETMDATNSKHIMTFGKLTGIDTSAFSVGDDLYIDTTTGVLTTTRPTGTALIQRVAKVLRSDISGGQLLIFNTARTAGLPNLPQDNFWIGDANAEPTANTGTQATAKLDTFTSSLKGLVPASGGSATDFLSADGTWKVAAVSDGDKGDITVSLGGTQWDIDNDTVTYAKIQDVTDERLLGNFSGGVGDVQELAISNDLQVVAGVIGLNTRPLYISDITTVNLLDDVANWDLNGNYTGTLITGTFQGQHHVNSSYWFTCTHDNVWIRIARI